MRNELVVPHHVLQHALAAIIGASRGNAAPTHSSPVALGLALLLAGSHCISWTLHDLRVPAHPGAELPSPALPVPSETAIVGVVVLSWTAREGALPRHEAQWQREMLAAQAAHHSLASGGDRPILMLAIDIAGNLAGRVHTQGRWLPLALVRLPGAGMHRVELHSAVRTVVPTDPLEFDEGRYSRLAGALGASVLQRLQRSVFVVVGAGRTGSSAAATLVRYGASVVLIDPDIAQAHNLGDGDGMLPSVHEGLPKVAALARSLKALVRPGAWLDARRLGVGSRIAGHLIAGADVLVSTVDNDAARLWAAGWAAALVLPHLDIGVAMPLQGGAGADVRLTLPGQGCLACVGGFADAEGLPQRIVEDAHLEMGFRAQRRGSARSIGVTAAHLGIRLVEQLYDGRLTTNRFIQLQEDHQSGNLTLTDASVARRGMCPVCSRLAGVGVLGLNLQVVAGLALRASRMHRAGD